LDTNHRLAPTGRQATTHCDSHCDSHFYPVSQNTHCLWCSESCVYTPANTSTHGVAGRSL